MDAGEKKRIEVMNRVLTDAMAELSVVSIDLAKAVTERQYGPALHLLIAAGEEQNMPSQYWRSIKQAADVLGMKDIAHLARAKRRETGLTDL